MTTGRINQVTIVCRGWPPAPGRRRRDVSSYWWSPAEGRAEHSAFGRAVGAAQRHSAFPLFTSPGHPSTALRPLWAVWLGRPRRRTRRTASTIAVSAGRGCPLMLCKRLANGQPSTEPVWRQRRRSTATSRTPATLQPALWRLGRPL